MQPLVATFSIVARDARNGDLGIAVASKFLAVGAVVAWAQAEVGAVATQALANLSFGPLGLQKLAQGQPADQVLKELLAADEGRDERQVGIVDAAGRAISWTGAGCMEWAGSRTGPGWAVQGNILSGPEVLDQMVQHFEQAEGELAERLLAALSAGDAAGGDRRGRQSAALYVVRTGGAYGGELDRYIDLRVDDHPAPVAELARLLKLHRFYMTRPDPSTLLTIDATLARELQTILRDLGYYTGPLNATYDDATRAALDAYSGVENLEERLVAGAKLDPAVLEYMRRQHAAAQSG